MEMISLTNAFKRGAKRERRTNRLKLATLRSIGIQNRRFKWARRRRLLSIIPTSGNIYFVKARVRATTTFTRKGITSRISCRSVRAFKV
jgi:hypothetical protein